jgi:DNA-directed RNA polymerase subunit beta
VKDTSLRVPTSVKGTVIDVRVFTRDGVEKDQRAKDIEKAELAQIRKDLDDEYRIVEAATYQRLRQALIGKKAASAPDMGKGGTVTPEYLDALAKDDWFRVRMAEMRSTRARPCGSAAQGASLLDAIYVTRAGR